jgi:hypothetical protein
MPDMIALLMGHMAKKMEPSNVVIDKLSISGALSWCRLQGVRICNRRKTHAMSDLAI